MQRRKPRYTANPGGSIALLTALLLLVAMPATGAMRCNGNLVDIGDWPVEVLESCGEPDYIARYPEAIIPGLGLTLVLEQWYYNRGPRQFVRRLTFRNGKLRQQETLGYGFSTARSGDCSPQDLHEGMSEYELHMRCGEPLSQRTWWLTTADRGYYHPAAYGIVPVEEWLYEFGPTRFRRVVRLEYGQVVRITARDKPE